MLSDIIALRARFAAPPDLAARVDVGFRVVSELGFDGLIYDFAPAHAARLHDVPAPCVLELRNIAPEMRALWLDNDYYAVDPVQRVAVSTSVPFYWHYDRGVGTAINPFLTDQAEPLCSFLRAQGMLSGVTIPLHQPDGSFATVTGIEFGRAGQSRGGEGGRVAALSLLAQLLHEANAEFLPSPPQPHLTARERECLQLAAEGLSAKEIGQRIARSEATVVMHLNAAGRKLGARNRLHAVTLALRSGRI